MLLKTSFENIQFYITVYASLTDATVASLLVSCCFDTGRPTWKNILWSGKWANCADCIIIQEVEAPLNIGDTEDSMNRYMLYGKPSKTITHNANNVSHTITFYK